MKMRKTRLCMAVASTIAAASLTPTLSWGFNIDASQLPPNLTSSSGGDMLLYPIYTTGDDGGSTTSFSLTNTSPDEVVIAKVRFREQVRSMDAMDFYIVLSPQDKFNFTVSKAAGQRPRMGWDGDKSCVVGPPVGATSFQFPVTNAQGNNNNSYVYDETALDAGHLEVLGVAAFQRSDNICYNASNDTVLYQAAGCNAANGDVNLAAAATHVNGVPPDCAALSAVLIDPGLSAALATALNTGPAASPGQKYPGDVPNALLGRYVITVPGGGIEGGGDAIAIQNSDLQNPANPPGTVAIPSQSQVTCASSGNCVSAYNWDTRDYDHPHLGDMPLGYLLNLNAGLAAVNVAGDWSNNPGNSVGVDWVLAFPTKYVYENVNLPPDLTGVTPPEGWPNFVMLQATPREGIADPWPWSLVATIPQEQFCLPTQVNAYGVDEETGTNQAVVSPSLTAELDFCNELNVLTYDINGQALEPSYVATIDGDGNSRRTTVSFDVSSANAVTNGWSVLSLSWVAPALPPAAEGIVYTVRDTDQANINNGSLTELQKNVSGQIGIGN
jgi:hypothetical protein